VAAAFGATDIAVAAQRPAATRIGDPRIRSEQRERRRRHVGIFRPGRSPFSTRRVLPITARPASASSCKRWWTSSQDICAPSSSTCDGGVSLRQHTTCITGPVNLPLRRLTTTLSDVPSRITASCPLRSSTIASRHRGCHVVHAPAAPQNSYISSFGARLAFRSTSTTCRGPTK
jgi:hypothetical protein